MASSKPTPKHRTRTIDIWENDICQAQREGDTVGLQIKTPNGVVQVVLPVQTLPDVINILQQAGALQGAQKGAVIVPGESVRDS